MKRVIGIIGIAAIVVLVLVSGALGTYSADKQSTIAKTERPDKEGVSLTILGDGGMQDPCVSPHRFDLPTRRPAAC